MDTRRSDQINEDLKTTSTWLLIAFFLGWGALILRVVLQSVGSHMGTDPSRGDVYSTLAYQTGTAFIWTLAWLTGGFLFGFVFGIPKVIAATTSASNPSPNAPSQNSSPKLKVNTNLEDISDWLTKVLVGATLTQIVKIPSAIRMAAEFMSVNDASRPVSFNAALLVYYSALGFLSGYILTRMFFARAFALADQGSSLPEEAAKTLDNAAVGFGLTASAPDEALRKAAIASSAVPITESLSANDAVRLAKGATLSGNSTRALTASELAVHKSPEDPEAQLTYAWSLRNSGASIETVLPIIEAAAGKLTEQSDPSLLSSIYASLAYLYLYQPPPNGFEKALRILQEYDSKNGPINADVEINRACAFGQKSSYLLNELKTDPASDALKADLDQARKGALASIQKAKNVDPKSAIRLKELLWVTADPKDNDLAAFQNDKEFTTLLPAS